MKRSTAILGSLALIIGAIAIPPAGAPSYGSQTDISSTARGAQLLQSAQRYLDAEHGAGIADLTGYTVIGGLDGDSNDSIWVVPADAVLPVVTQTTDGFTISLPADTPVVSGFGGGGGHFGASRSGSLSWSASTCYARWSNFWGWMDRCSQWGKVINDGDNARDHWVYKTYATCKSTSNTYIQTCFLSSVKSTASPTLYWEDWAPKADSSGSCRTTSISVSAYGVGVSGSYQACDQVDITKGAAAGSFSNTFRTPSVYMQERSVQFQIALGTAQGGIPVLAPSWGITGYLKIG